MWHIPQGGYRVGTMSDYTIRVTRRAPYEQTVADARTALADQGFGIISEVDLAATLRAKLGVDVAPQLILGACRPQLAHRAITAEPAVATLLPCNVVVRADGPDDTIIEAFDPAGMTALGVPGGAIGEVAAEARERLVAALTALATQGSGTSSRT